MFGDGFIPGSRGSFFLDFLACSLIALLFLQGVSIILVKYYRQYLAHKRLQVLISTLVVVLLVFFEVEVRLLGWKERAFESPFYDTLLMPVLILHISIAVVFLLMWCFTMRSAWRGFSNPPRPSSFSRTHIREAKLSVLAMLATVLSGWWFYYLAFLAA